MKNRSLTIAVSIAIALLATWGISVAQAPAGFKRVELQRHDLSTPRGEAITARAEFQAGAVVPKHSHPGEEFGYVLKGEVTLEIEGSPAKTLKAGDSFFVAAGTVHTAKAGKDPAEVLSTYVVEKGKPLATPVAPPAKK